MERFGLADRPERQCRPQRGKISTMSYVTYSVVEHDGGWAYKVGDVFSETFRTRQEAHAAAERAAQEQRAPGQSSAIEYEDSSGRWHVEEESGEDRPDTNVKD
jgi:hypothetical protein